VEPIDRTYALARDTEVLEFDTSLPGPRLLVTTRKGKYFQVGGLAREVLLSLRGQPGSPAMIRDRIQQRTGRDCPQDIVAQALSGLQASAILETENAIEHSPSKVRRVAFNSYFGVRVSVLSERVLKPLTSRLAPLFHPRLVAWLLPALFLLQLVLWLKYFNGFRGWLGSLTPASYAWLLAANYLGLFLHELGHASACVRCGVSHGPIGAGIYLIFPAFYTDVTSAWRLPRQLRAVVDTGGIYMSLLAATFATAMYATTGRPFWAILAGLYDATVWINLWPFIRMDGYWLLSDLVGVPNLMAANRELTAWLWNSLFGRNTSRPRILVIEPRWLRWLYLAYYPLFLGSVAWLAWRIGRWYAPMLVSKVPQLAHALIVEAHLHGASFGLLPILLRILLLFIPMIGLSLYAMKAVARVRRLLERLIKRRVAKPDTSAGATASARMPL
jgi:hypothetical protein